MTGGTASAAAAYLYRYLDLDAETAKVDWEFLDGGEANKRVRDLAQLLVCAVGPGAFTRCRKHRPLR